ncbi:MAG: DNA polymerase II large subunit [Candidatus Bathyarchaeia archaeon]
MNIICSENYAKYFANLEAELGRILEIANKAKARGLDVKRRVEDEIRISRDLADRVEYMIGPHGVGKRIQELHHLPRTQLAFKIAEEIVYGGFGVYTAEAAAEQAVKTGAAILNEGVTVAPLQGIVKVAIKQRWDELGRSTPSRYLSLYFAGPMRSAGGTELALVTVLGDYVRRLLGLDAYKAQRDEIGRFCEELRLYEREVGRFQFHVTDEVIENILSHLPVEVTGIKTDPVEVSSYRNLPSVETNCVRGGALRVINDGIAGRALKVWKVINEINLTGWDWLKSIGEVKRDKSEDAEPTYLQDIIAGRPVFSFPFLLGRGCGFRLRYGRSRNTGLACVGVHPITMSILNDFIAVGTQLRLEMPGKAGVVSSVDTIEPPIVKLKDGSVARVETSEKRDEVKGKVEKVLFLGDLLIAVAEFLENGKPLMPSGFVEEWWACEVKKAMEPEGDEAIENISKVVGIPAVRLRELLTNYLKVKPSADEAVKISTAIKIPLHPRYCYFWRNISVEELKALRSRILGSDLEVENKVVRKITLNLDVRIKTIMEKLLLPHKVSDGKIIVDEDAPTLARCLGIPEKSLEIAETPEILRVVSELAGFEVRDKYPSFVGVRMGRPEKADERKMKPPVHVLFPIGLSGGAQRNISEVDGSVEVEIARKFCKACGVVTYEARCQVCGYETVPQAVCPVCSRTLADRKCSRCNAEGRFYSVQVIPDMRERLMEACRRLGVNLPKVLKGVKGLMSANKIPEPLEKGILRAKYDLYVFKDGTVRYDLTNAPLTHFRPSEIGVSIDRLKRLGYTIDRHGNPLESSDQTCELKVQDLIIPERCGDYLARVANFIDELLARFYGLDAFYKAEDRYGLLGHLVVGLSPHTSAGVLGRIIGFSKLNVCYSHPLWISAKRRDCDGDEDALILALDVFLNFSREFLPAQIGGLMDAPLLLTPIIAPQEVDDQVWTLELNDLYPLEFYYNSLVCVDSKYALKFLDTVGCRLGRPAQYEGYSFIHDVTDINIGVRENRYKRLGTMMDKLQSQMALMDILEGVDAKDVARRVLGVHFMRDIAGNLRVFASQSFRCKRCNSRYRRIPLKGRCLRCGGQLSLTVFKGTVEKYLKVAEWIAKTYGLEDYYNQRVALISDEIASVFAGGEEETKEKVKATELTDFM